MSRVQTRDNYYRDFNKLRDRVSRLERVSSQLLLKDVNTTGLTNAQIDAAVFGGSTGGQASDGLVISDKTNGLMLVRESGVWKRFLSTTAVSAARAFRGSASGTLAALYQFLNVDSIDYDPGNHFDLPNARYIVPSPGIYMVTSTFGVANLQTGQYYNSIQVNGVIRLLGENSTGGFGGVVAGMLNLNTGDAVKAAFSLSVSTSLVIANYQNDLTIARIA